MPRGEHAIGREGEKEREQLSFRQTELVEMCSHEVSQKWQHVIKQRSVDVRMLLNNKLVCFYYLRDSYDKKV